MPIEGESGRWVKEKNTLVEPADGSAFEPTQCTVLVLYHLRSPSDDIRDAPSFVVGTVPGLTVPPLLAERAPAAVEHADWDRASDAFRTAATQKGIKWDVKAALSKCAKWIASHRSGAYLGIFEPPWLAGKGVARDGLLDTAGKAPRPPSTSPSTSPAAPIRGDDRGWLELATVGPGQTFAGVPLADLPAHLSRVEWSTVRKLRIRGSGIDAAGVTALSEISDLSRLEGLWLPRGAFGASELAHLLSRLGPSLELLDFERSPVGDEGAAAIARAELPGLRRLWLQKCGLGPAGAVALAEGVAEGLLHLKLDENAIGDAGVDALAVSPRLGALERLELQDTCFGDAGGFALARSTTLTSLRQLMLSRNRMSPKVAGAFLDAIYLDQLEKLGANQTGWRPRAREITDWAGGSHGTDAAHGDVAALKARLEERFLCR